MPIGRDTPYGLNVRNFLGPTSPFGAVANEEPAEARLSDAELIGSLVQPANQAPCPSPPICMRRADPLPSAFTQMSLVLSARLQHLRVIGSLWATAGPVRALEHALNMDDLAVLVDVLGASTSALHVALTLDLALDLAAALARLLDSEYEDYLLCGLNTLGALLKASAPILRSGLAAPRDADDAVDDERRDRCVALQGALRALGPRLEEVGAAGKSRSAQLAARTLRSLRRHTDDAPEQY